MESNTPKQAIQSAYYDSIEARQQYMRAIGTDFEQSAHERLHNTVSTYYEVLRPLISTANATQDLWENEALWPTHPATVDVGYCPACNSSAEKEELDDLDISIGDLCPHCGNAVIEREEKLQTDEHGQTIYHHVTGLESVSGLFNQVVERQIEYQSALGHRTETRVERELLDPNRLFVIAQALDDAMQTLGLHVDIDDDVQTSEIDEDTLDRFSERLEEIRQQWGEQDGIEDKEVPT